MKIQIDTTEKAIKIEDTVNFGELMNELEKMLPLGAWKEYSLIQQIIIPFWENPLQPFWQIPSITPLLPPFTSPIWQNPFYREGTTTINCKLY